MSDNDWAIAGTAKWPGTAKVMEECGELVQVLAKLVAFGEAGDHWDGTNLLDRIHDEVGDVLGALDFLITMNELDPDRVLERRQEKFRTFLQWYNS